MRDLISSTLMNCFILDINNLCSILCKTTITGQQNKEITIVEETPTAPVHFLSIEAYRVR